MSTLPAISPSSTYSLEPSSYPTISPKVTAVKDIEFPNACKNSSSKPVLERGWMRMPKQLLSKVNKAASLLLSV